MYTKTYFLFFNTASIYHKTKVKQTKIKTQNKTKHKNEQYKTNNKQTCNSMHHGNAIFESIVNIIIPKLGI